jgi:predicted dehydrogenase
MNPLKVGLIGCGDMGFLRASALTGSPWMHLLVVSDLDQGRARRAAGESGAEIQGDWKTVVRRPELDAIMICTPPDLHAEMCMEALRAGKHVLCEKPLARSPEECRRILEVAEKSGMFLSTGFNYRFYPSFELAREWVRSGRIGKISHIKSFAGYSARDHNHDWIHDAGITGGGALRDNGIHLIDLTRFFLGEVTEVAGFASNSIWKFKDCEDNGFLTMRNHDGAIASLHASWTEFRKYHFMIEIYGTGGSIRASCFPMYAELVQTGAGGEKPRRSANYFPYVNVMEHWKSYRWVVIQSLGKELEAFAAAIRKEPSIVGTGYDGLRAVEIANAASTKFE